jgi:hypothetical protein
VATQPAPIVRIKSLGIGWLIALVVLILAILNLIGGTSVDANWLILGLALAVLL